MTCSLQKFITLSKSLLWSFQNEQFCLKNTVLQNLYTHEKDSVTHQNQNTSVDQICVLGCWYLFQGKQTFKISTFLPDSKQTKFWQSCLFFSETWRLFHTWLCQAPVRQKLPSCVRRGQIFLLPCPTLCDSSLRAWWWPDKEMPSCGNQDHLLTHPSPCVLRALTGLKATWGSPHAAEGAQHQHLSSIPSFSHKTTFTSLLPFMLAEERSFVLPKAAVLCRVPTATSSWLISSNSCSPLHASKEQSYF